MSAHPVLAPLEAYRRWAAAWDTDPSAIVALETRAVAPWLARLEGARVVDIACGTGRWLEFCAGAGARVAGVDFCGEMLARAAGKPGLRGRLAAAEAARLPIAGGCADVVLCTLSLGHMAEAAPVLEEMARIARAGGAAIVSDFHPEAFRRGWKRTFRSGGQVYEIENHYHSLEEMTARAAECGLELEEAVEPCFGEQERPIYAAAGRMDLFEQVRGIPAVMAARWRKRS